MYTKILQTKIIRTKHKVEFNPGTRACDLMKFLSNVPREAKITNISEGDDEGNAPYIIFEEEKEDN